MKNEPNEKLPHEDADIDSALDAPDPKASTSRDGGNIDLWETDVEE